MNFGNRNLSFSTDQNDSMTCFCIPKTLGGGFTRINLLKKLKDYQKESISYDIVREYFDVGIKNMLKTQSTPELSMSLHSIWAAIASEEATYELAIQSIESFKHTKWDVISILVDRLPSWTS